MVNQSFFADGHICPTDLFDPSVDNLSIGFGVDFTNDDAATNSNDVSIFQIFFEYYYSQKQFSYRCGTSDSNASISSNDIATNNNQIVTKLANNSHEGIVTSLDSFEFRGRNCQKEKANSEEFFNAFRLFVQQLNPQNDSKLYTEIVWRNLIIVIAYFLIVLVSLFGNLLVLFIILSRQQLRAQTTNKLIANLTISDLLLTTINIPLTIVRLVFDSWQLGSVLCYIGRFAQAVSVYVSTISMTVIAIDRHQVLLGSLPKRVSSSLSSVWTILCVWILSAAFSIPHFVFNKVVHRQFYKCVKRCQATYPSEKYSKIIGIFTFLSQYLIPLTIIMICYAHIGIHIWNRVHLGAMTRSQKDNHLQSRKRTIKMLVLIVLAHAILWFPLNMYHLTRDFLPNSNLHLYKTLYTFCHWMGTCSVAVNPFVYFWLNKQYKQQARKILGICFKCCWKNRSQIEREKTQSGSSFENEQNKSNCSCNRKQDIFAMKSYQVKRSKSTNRTLCTETIEKRLPVFE